MFRQKPSLFLLAFASIGTAELVDVTLTLTPVTPTENTLALTLQVPVIGGDSDSSEVSGTIQARIDIDPVTGDISSLELLSGNISGTAVSFARSAFLIGSYDLTTSVIGGTVDTPAPPAPVTSNQSAAELHEFIINSGTLSGSASILGQTTNVSEDFNASPVSGTGTPGDFVNLSSTANPGASTPTLAVFDLDFNYPIDITQEVDVGVTVTFEATGNMRATGQASIAVTPPNPYLVWAAANGITEAPFEGNDFSEQVPNGLFWALGYSAGDEAESLTPVADGSGTFNLSLPPGGTVADVTVQLSFDLSNPNSWSDVSTISAGTSGVQGPYGGGSGPAFLRLSVADPSE